jgi:glucans biosynthesis protein C
MAASSIPDSRLYFLDWLRILAFAGLVVYHVGMYYVNWDFHVKSPFAGPGLEPWMKLTEPWRMSLLFMVSGAATSYMLKSGPSLGLVRRRSAHLLLPLLIGVVLVVPPQSYFQVVQKFNYSGGYLEFLGLYFSRYRDFCTNGQCLILPTWNHLWFLPYLWVYTLLACGVLAVWPAALRSASWLFERSLRGVWLMALPIVLILVARLALFERYPSTHALLGDWFNHAIYLGMFFCGVALAASSTLWGRLASARWVALSMALAFWAVLVFVRPAKPFEHAVVAIYQWSALVAAFGFAITHLNRDWPIRQRLTEAMFPVYILHQTVIVVGSQFLLPLQLKPAVEGPLIVVLTFVLSYTGYLFIRRFGILRPWFGLKPKEPKTYAPSLSGA